MAPQDVWLVSAAAAFLAVTAIVWAVVVVRRFRRDRRLLIRGLRCLGEGDLTVRLDAEEIGPVAADTFNQAARDLENSLDGLRRTSRLLREMARHFPDRVLVALDAEGLVQEVLGDLESISGYTRDGVLGRHTSFFFASEDEWDKLMKEALDGGGSCARPVPLRRRGGEVATIQAGLERTPDGPVHLALSTEVAQEQMLKQASVAEERLAALTAGLADGVVILVGGRIASVNACFADMLGYKEEELVGRPFTQIVAAEDLVQATDIISGTSWMGATEVEMGIRSQAGHQVTLAFSVGQSELEGKPVRVLLARDVTARRARERRLSLDSAWLAGALEASPLGELVLARAPAGTPWPVAVANGSVLRWLGLLAERLPDRRELDAAMDRLFLQAEPARAFLRACQDDPGVVRSERFEVSSPPGGRVQLTWSPIDLGEGTVAGALLSVREITRQERTEKDLREKAEESNATLATLQRSLSSLERDRDQLTARLGELEERNRGLEERDEMKTNLLSNFSHELQAPLVSIRGYTEMMLRGDLGETTPDQHQGLEVSLRNIKRLIALIEQLSTYARTEERLTELTLETFPIWRLLEDNINLLGDKVKEKALRVTTRYETQRLSVLADRNLVNQVVSNLLGNAIKFSPEGGEVALTVRAGSKEDLVVEVRDSGVGIPREEQERIFERGYRATTASGTRGSGIGLALVKEILKRHGCQIRVDSRPGEGSIFSFTLPLAETEVNEASARQ
ncbi:MAG: ATP-binding protein [Acidobacteriota bacterium]